ncbi:MAG: BON domain-containing protein [Acidobacteria bacterium]|nr:BON domain-containing protein [Acidobacteriota bacterium]
MLTHSIAQKIILLVLLTSLLLVGAFAQGNKKPAKPAPPAKVDCSTVTDADIVKSIQDKIKADPAFQEQLKQINVSSDGRVVTLEGRVKGNAAKNTIGKYAKSVKCVKRVQNNLSTKLKVGCSAGQKLCGDICISAKSGCNIM